MKKLHHKSSPLCRQSISEQGLIPQVGDSYSLQYDESPDLVPAIFLYDPEIEEYDSTYDDDIWEVEVDENDLQPDICEALAESGCVMMFKPIPNPKLIYEGTGEDSEDEDY